MNDTKEMNKVTSIFSTASLDVVRQMTRSKIEHGSTHIKEHFYPSYDCLVIIKVTGKYEGAVIMSIKEETAVYLASAMIGNKPAKQLDEMSESAVCELANMTISRSLMQAAGDDSFNISPPTFVKANSESFTIADENKTYVTTLNTPGGVIEFNILLEIAIACK